MKIAIAGAAGNLGGLLSSYLADFSHTLVLLVHHRPVAGRLLALKNVEVKHVDLGNERSLTGCLAGVDCVISVAGVLFRGAPEKFLPITNTKYVENLANEGARSGISKFVLLSFPHVEGETSPDSPARGIIPDVEPQPIHARTRLAAERRLLKIADESSMAALVVRAGVIYGKGVKLTEAARKCLRFRLLAIWRNPTWVHLLAIPDFLRIMKRCIEDYNLSGILNVADDQPILLSDFLNRLAQFWNHRPPIILPESYFEVAARFFDLTGRVLHCPVPFNSDILRMATMSAVCDTSRLKLEMGYRLKFPNLEAGLSIC